MASQLARPRPNVLDDAPMLDGSSRAEPARIEEEQHVFFRISMKRNVEHVLDDDVDPALLRALASERSLWALAGLELASRKLPQSFEMRSPGPLRQEVTVAFAHDRGRDDDGHGPSL